MMPGPPPVITAKPWAARSAAVSCARRAEDRDAATQRREFIEAFDKLTHDPEHAPRIGMRKLVGTRALEQLLVLCRSRKLLPA
jgi:hypothetical protein